jgi:hypothetical protein
MREVVKQSLALAGPKNTVTISCVYDGSCVYDHLRTRKMVPKEHIIDNAPRTTTANQLIYGWFRVRYCVRSDCDHTKLSPDRIEMSENRA